MSRGCRVRTAKRSSEPKTRRKPVPADSAFRDPQFDPSRPVDMEAFQAELVNLMRRANVRPDLIRAYRRTGLLVTEKNWRFLSPEDRREWELAVTECHKRNEKAAEGGPQ